MGHQHSNTLFLNIEDTTDAINQLTGDNISVLTHNSDAQYSRVTNKNNAQTKAGSTRIDSLVDTGVLVFPKLGSNRATTC